MLPKDTPVNRACGRRDRTLLRREDELGIIRVNFLLPMHQRKSFGHNLGMR